MVAIVTAIDGKPNAAFAPGGGGMWIDAPSSAVSPSPKPSAASQCPAAIQRFRHSSHSSASAQAGTSTSRSPSEASAAISRSASGLRRVRMLAAHIRSTLFSSAGAQRSRSKSTHRQRPPGSRGR